MAWSHLAYFDMRRDAISATVDNRASSLVATTAETAACTPPCVSVAAFESVRAQRTRSMGEFRGFRYELRPRAAHSSGSAPIGARVCTTRRGHHPRSRSPAAVVMRWGHRAIRPPWMTVPRRFPQRFPKTTFTGNQPRPSEPISSPHPRRPRAQSPGRCARPPPSFWQRRGWRACGGSNGSSPKPVHRKGIRPVEARSRARIHGGRALGPRGGARGLLLPSDNVVAGERVEALTDPLQNALRKAVQSVEARSRARILGGRALGPRGGARGLLLRFWSIATSSPSLHHPDNSAGTARAHNCTAPEIARLARDALSDPEQSNGTLQQTKAGSKDEATPWAWSVARFAPHLPAPQADWRRANPAFAAERYSFGGDKIAASR